MNILSFVIIAMGLLGMFETASGMSRPQIPPQIRRQVPLTPPSLLDLQRQQERGTLLEQAIKNRQRLGLAVPDNVRVVESLSDNRYAPKRNYAAQSCYHMIDTKDPSRFTFCNADRCTFEDGGYCEHPSGDCYDADGTLILNPKGQSEAGYDNYLSIKWDLCLAADGSPAPPPGEKPYEERIRAGCAYRVGKKIHPYYQGYTGYLMTCDAYQCLFHPGGIAYNRETKLYTDGNGETKTPPVEYFPYLDWTCLDAKKANRVASKYRCSIEVEDDENWGCQVCFVNGKHAYSGCKYIYNERGEQVGARVHIGPALQEQLDELARRRMAKQAAGNFALGGKLVELEILFRKTPVSDAAQGKVAALFEKFFERNDDEAWSDARLNQELAALRQRIQSVIRK